MVWFRKGSGNRGYEYCFTNVCHCGDVRNNVFLYFAEKIILHTSKAFVEVWIAGLLSLFFDIFALVAIEKEADILILLPILSANYISGRLHGLPWWPSGIYAWIFSGKRA